MNDSMGVDYAKRVNHFVEPHSEFVQGDVFLSCTQMLIEIELAKFHYDVAKVAIIFFGNFRGEMLNDVFVVFEKLENFCFLQIFFAGC